MNQYNGVVYKKWTGKVPAGRLLKRGVGIAALAIFLAATVPDAIEQGHAQSPVITEGDREAVLLSRTRQLIFEGKRSGEGYWNRAGDKIVFQSEREPDNPFYQIYTLDFNTGDIELISPGDGKTTCAYFNWADESEILFSSTHEDPQAQQKMQDEIDFRASGQSRKYAWDYDPNMHLFVRNTQSGQVRQLTDAFGYDAEGSFSPNGEYIAFASTRSAYEGDLSPQEEAILERDVSYFGEIYIMKADGSELKRLTHTPGYDGGPFFSPDGQRIVWRRFDEKGLSAEVFTMNIDGSDQRQVTDLGAMSWAPFYHPSGQYIIFATNKLGFANFELFIVDADGRKEPQRVTTTEGFDGLPVFAPEGERLLWTSTRTNTGQSQLFIAQWDHQAALELLAQAPQREVAEPDELAQQAISAPALGGAEISADELEAKVRFFASDALEGRMTGSDGLKMAADQAVDWFQALGLSPVGESGFRHSFDFVRSVELASSDGNRLSVKTEQGVTDYTVAQAYMPMAFSANETVQAEVVFAGHGLTAPDELSVQFDDYANIDVEGKLVMVLTGTPEHLSEQDKQALAQIATPRFKAVRAARAGAAGIIFIDDDQSPNGYSTLGREAMLQQAGIVAARVQPSVADEWILSSGLEGLDSIRDQFVAYNPHASTSKPLGIDAELAVDLNKVEQSDVNVVGQVRAQNASKTIVIGAHLDHLGFGEANSLATGASRDRIHPGADDNASGSAVVIELAEYFSRLEANAPGTLGANLVFALWSGEELGLIGSSAFLDSNALEDASVSAYLNFDMVGMLEDNALIVQGLGSSTDWARYLERNNVMAGFDLTLLEDPYVPTDAMAFYLADIPVLAFFTGLHDHYHRPSDKPDNLNYDGLARIAEFGQGVLADLHQAEPVEFQSVAMSSSQMAAGRGFSVTLGTIPDYASEGDGVRLSGVREGSPAQRAGVQADDVIVGLAGEAVGDLYDYTAILGELEVGVGVSLVVIRSGEELELMITPAAR